MQAMADAGAPFGAIVIAMRALDEKDQAIAAKDAAAAEKRARDAERKRAKRSDGNGKKRPRTILGLSTECPAPPPIDIIHTPPDISSDDESQSERVTPAAVADRWNAVAKPVGLAGCGKMDGKRLQSCRARIREHGFEGIGQAIEHIPKSAFLRGEVGNWSGATIDFLLKPGSITKILEGQYDDRKKHGTVNGNSGPVDRRTSLQRVADEAIAALGG